MLEITDLEDRKIISYLRNEYGLKVVEFSNLQLGADFNSAAYRLVADDGKLYFLKLRRGDFDEARIAVPNYLYALGIQQIIPALTTQAGQLWAGLDSFRLFLYPFVEGHNGYEVNLLDQQRVEFGSALKRFHTAEIPSAITNSICREQFSAQWRSQLKHNLARIQNETFYDPVAEELAAYLNNKRTETLQLVGRAERLAHSLQAQTPEYILCHGDIHAWNLLIDANDALYIVDWDTLIFAPKERDLMFVGGGLGGYGHTLQEEETLFYQGYGQTEINSTAIAYYRYERIIEDIAIYCEHILLSEGGGEDREKSLVYLKSNFLPGGTIEIACQSDKSLGND